MKTANNGCMGKILWVDLDRGLLEEREIAVSLYRKYLSGSGMAVRILYDAIPKAADPLGPENVLCFVSGLLTGTGSLFTGRWMAAGKSPLTGTWGDANCGGNFSPAIKRCGYDGIFFSGISRHPVYLCIHGEKAELRDAKALWGKDTKETERFLKAKAGCNNPRIACIGPAGENLSLISGIANDGGRMAARSGLGAVMGSKRLKAVVLDGVQRISSNNKAEIKRLSKACNDSIQFMPPFPPANVLSYLGAFLRALPAQPSAEALYFNTVYKRMLQKWGTASLNQILIELGDTPIKNWKGSNEDFPREHSAKLNPDVFSDCVVVRYHCYSCPLGCGGLCLRSGIQGETHKPEYETVMALGGLCMNDDSESIFRLNEKLNRAGMDTISAGGTVAFAIECFEKGILTTGDTDGLALTWGNRAAIEALVDKMIARDGIGDLLADGVKMASQKIGRGSGTFAIHAGGQELAMHDGRFDPGFALHNSVEATPGRHTIGSQLYYELFRLWEQVSRLPEPDLIYLKRSKYVPDREKAVAAAACSKYMNIINGSGACMYGALFGLETFPLFKWLEAATGWGYSPDDYMVTGARIQTLKQMFNLKQGIEPGKIKMTDRALGRPPLSAGANKGRAVPVERMIRDYWDALEWDPETGHPTEALIKRLEL
ncbi:MAG: aldehyde ferredoxin oxidoreductase family protein [Deltaproteobacteria bacterium]|nr:aldehyde ferredoxin oxidoreductase family protein [Deltaproteobacteria bacterium]